MQQREHDDVVHHLEAGVVARDQVRHRDAEQLAEDRPQFRQAVQAAVVAGVGAVAVAVLRARQGQQLVGQVELRRRRLAAGEVQAQLLGLQVGVVAALQLVLRLQFVTAEGQKRHGAPFNWAMNRAVNNEGDPAHPPEPIDPCCLPALGEFTGWTPRGVRRECSTRARGVQLVRSPVAQVGYHGPRRIRLVAYGARLERGLG